MAKPDLIKWVTDDDAAKISDPGSTKKLAGWIYTERPPFQFLNWLWNITSKWFMGLQGSYADIIVGSATQVTNNEATHVVDDLNDVLVVAGSRITILDGTHILASNLALTNNDIIIESESTEAIIDVSTFTISISGLRTFSKFNLINAGAGDVSISGAGSQVYAYGITQDVITKGSNVISFILDTVTEMFIGERRLDGFDSGTRMLFQQTATPFGWTKDTTHNNKALRIVNGAVSTGGTSSFTTAFGSGKTTDSQTLSTSQIPAHDHGPAGTHGHTMNIANNSDTTSNSTGKSGAATPGAGTNSGIIQAVGDHTHTSVGGGAGHAHNLSNFDLMYVDFIIGVKDS